MNFTRTDQSGYRSVFNSIPQEIEDLKVKAARKAEMKLSQMIRNRFSEKEARIFLNKRVSSKKDNCGFEIDLIVVTKDQIHLLEIKNWSGKLYSEGKQWVQINERGDRIDHENPLEHILKKQKALVHYLKTNGVNINSKCFKHRIIFMNRNLRVNETITSNPNVIPIIKIGRYFDQLRSNNKEPNTKHLSLETSSKINNSYRNKIIQHISNLHTWDTITLFGGNVVEGDILNIIINNYRYIIQKSFTNTKIEIHWPIDYFSGLPKALISDQATGVIIICGQRFSISANDKILFHRVGQKAPQIISIDKIVSLTKG